MNKMVAGDVFAGWRIERELARGGMGVLYLARHPRLPRTDVLKVLPPWLAEDRRFRERFLREASRMSALSHPHIVVVHDSGEYEGTLYLAMQYVRGGDLRALLAAGQLPPKRVLLLGQQIASALDAAHRAGVVHRDVKPENVLLAEDIPGEPDHAVLTDFGISREEAQPTTLTATGELLLTPAYAAPEQVSATVIDGRADQYSLACMLYELLTGAPPYGNSSALAMLAAHLHQPVRSLPPELGLPMGVDRALQRAMAKQPEERFGSCREFLDAGLAALDDVTEPRRSTEPQRPTEPRRPTEPQRSAEPPTAAVPPARPRAPTPLLPPAPFLPPAGAGPDSPARRRRWPWLAGLAAAALIGIAALLIVPGLVGGGTDPATSKGGAFAALAARIPGQVRAGCTDATGELSAPEARYVAVRAACRTTLHGQAFDVSYDAVRGDASVGTTYRRDVLGIGSKNNAPGDCRTRTRDPKSLNLPSRLGLYMPPGPPPLNVDVWCQYTGVMYLLQPDPTSAIFVRSERIGDDGDIADQQQRYDDLAAVQPS
jgi:serine/threonine protein kinase